MTPRTDITVGGSRGSAVIPAVIDTGFEGYVCVPVQIAERLGIELTGRTVAVLADGTEKEDLLFSGWVEFLGKRRTVEMCLTTDEPLIGTGLWLTATSRLISFPKRCSYRASQATPKIMT